jgi:hypothetical protein
MTSVSDTHPKWDRQHFLAFLLLCAANADMAYTDAERKFILDKVGATALEAIRREHDDCNDYEHIQLVQKYKDLYFKTDEDKQQLLKDIKDLFEVDGEYSQTEHNLFMMLRKLL